MIIDDIKIGDIVRVSQLKNIYDINIFLADCTVIDDGEDITGRIIYIGREINKESDNILFSHKRTYCFYQNPLDESEDASWED